MASYTIEQFGQTDSPVLFKLTDSNDQVYAFAPKEFIDRGYVDNGEQFYPEWFLNPKVSQSASFITLPKDAYFGEKAKQVYTSPETGYIWKLSDLTKYTNANATNYKITAEKPAIQGLVTYQGQPAYSIGATSNTDQSFIDNKGFVQGIVYPKSDGGDFFSNLLSGNIGAAFASLDPSASISRAATSLFQPAEQTISTNLAQLDKDLSLSQNAPLIAAATAAYLSGGTVGGEGLAAGGAEGWGGAGAVGSGGSAGLLGSGELATAAGAGAATEAGTAGISSIAPGGNGLLSGSSGTGISAAPSTTGYGLAAPSAVEGGLGLTVPSAPGIAEMGGAQGLTIPSAGGGILGATGVGLGTAGGLLTPTNTFTGEPLGGELAKVDTGIPSQIDGGAGGAGGTDAATAARVTNFLRKLLGGTGMATTAQQGLGSLLGGLLQTAGGAVQGGQSAAAAEEQARQIAQATGQAVAGSQFRPVGTTTRFGTSQFQVDPTTGQLISAGYQVSPEQAALQTRLQGLMGTGLTQAEQAQQQYAPLTAGAQGLFGLGQQYLATSPQQAAADYMARQQALLQPSRDVESARLATQLQNTGRTGLSVAQGGALGAANPEQQALANARAMQDLALAAQAQTAGQQATQFGAGLLGTGANLLGGYYGGQQAAYAPFTSALGQQAGLEQLAQQPLSLSQQLAQLSSTAGGRAGQLGIAGTTAAAQARLPSMQYSPLANILSGAGGNTQFGNLLGQAAGNALPGLLGLFSGGMPTASDVYSAYVGLGNTGYSAADLAGLV
jgi:hypothetical protein